MNKKFAIIIPFHKRNLNKFEIISLKVLTKNFSRNKIFFVTSKKNQIKGIGKKIQHIYFPKFFFKSVNHYNLLLQSNFFYKKMSKFDFILIYQLDCLIFSSNIKYWINKDYAFIGSPFIRFQNNNIIFKKGLNGGLSLRKPNSYLEFFKNDYQNLFKFEIIKYCSSPKRFSNFIYNYIKSYLTYIFLNKKKKFINIFIKNYKLQEDIFWSIFAKEINKKFSVSESKDALNFSFEEYPERCFSYTGNKIPFGCHQWTYWNKKFWLDIIKKKYKIFSC